MLSREQPIVIIADPGREQEAAMRLGRIGFDHVAGYLEDGLHSLESRPELTMSTERLSAQVAAERWRPRSRPGAGHGRRPGAGRARAEAHRRQREHSAQPSRRTAVGTADRSAAPRLLRGRLSLVDRARACCSGTGSTRSARSPAASRRGKRRSCPLESTPPDSEQRQPTRSPRHGAIRRPASACRRQLSGAGPVLGASAAQSPEPPERQEARRADPGRSRRPGRAHDVPDRGSRRREPPACLHAAVPDGRQPRHLSGLDVRAGRRERRLRAPMPASAGCAGARS